MSTVIIMDCDIHRIAGNIIEMEMENGSHVKIVFSKEDNPEIENIVTNNLLMSYEQRIRKEA